MAIAQTEMSAVSAVIAPGEAQRLCDATVEEWFALRVATMANATLVEEVGKRLVTMLARRKLAETQPALTKTSIAEAIACAISLTLFK